MRSRPPAACWLTFISGLLAAALHGQTLYDFGNPTGDEQLYIELINRARADPPAEGARLAASTNPSNTPQDRVIAAGYSYNSMAENAYAYYSNTFRGHAGFQVQANGDAPEPAQPKEIPPPARDEPLSILTGTGASKPMTKCLQESRMREICTSGLTRGSNGNGASRPLLSTLLVRKLFLPKRKSRARNRDRLLKFLI